MIQHKKHKIHNLQKGTRYAHLSSLTFKESIEVIHVDRIINDGYYKINLENIILIVRSILGMENENTFRVTIVYHENITDLVYFSKGKIVKYAKKVENNSSYLDILYTVKKGLNINTNNKDSDFVDLIPNEVKRMNNLENIKDITLKKSDLLLYEIYKLFKQIKK